MALGQTMSDTHDDDLSPEEKRRARAGVEVVVWFRRLAIITGLLIVVGLVLTLSDQAYFFKSASQRHDIEEEQKLRAILPEGVLQGADPGEKIPLYEDPEGPTAGQIRKELKAGTEVIILSNRVVDGEPWAYVQVIGTRGLRGWIPKRYVHDAARDLSTDRRRVE